MARGVQKHTGGSFFALSALRMGRRGLVKVARGVRTRHQTGLFLHLAIRRSARFQHDEVAKELSYARPSSTRFGGDVRGIPKQSA